MARRTKEEAQQTRCNIMSTALDLFCQQGAGTHQPDRYRQGDGPHPGRHLLALQE